MAKLECYSTVEGQSAWSQTLFTTCHYNSFVCELILNLAYGVEVSYCMIHLNALCSVNHVGFMIESLNQRSENLRIRTNIDTCML